MTSEEGNESSRFKPSVDRVSCLPGPW